MSVWIHGETLKRRSPLLEAQSSYSKTASAVKPHGTAGKSLTTMRVTFDTNVWNRMVLPEKWIGCPNYDSLVRINEAIRNGQIRGFISEGFATAESISKRNRARYHVQSVPAVEVTPMLQSGGSVSMSIDIRPKHDQHPGIGEDFEEELTAALAIGVKLLTTPYIGLAVPDRLRNNPHIYAEEVFTTTDYNERFGNAVRAINDRGVGEGALAVLAREFTEQLDGSRPTGWSDRDFIYRVYEYACLSGRNKEKRQVEKAFAESADGDLVAAHIAFGNDYLCTEDRARSTVSRSVFDLENRTWLEAEYGTEIVDAKQLTSLL
jgi:hypothetical protein